MLGYPAEHYVGRAMADFVPDVGAMAEVLRRMRACETIRGYELPMRREDGAVRWIRLDANPWARNGEILHARCFLADITEKRRADEAQMLLAAIVQSSEDAVVSKDLNSVVTSWNPAAERILGWTAKEMIGRSILTIIPPELHRDEPEILRKIRAGERVEHFETVRVTKNGERIDVSLTISPVRNAKGKIIGAAKILRDVTAQKKLEATLRTTERLASVGRLAATVAHEINNPLEAVTNLIYLARLDPALPESARGCLAAADEELQRVTHIARQTLGFYRDTSQPVIIDVAEAIEEVLAIYDRRLRYKELRVQRHMQPGLTVCALMGEFKQVLSNLVANAIDAALNRTEIRIRAWAGVHPATGVPGIRVTVADEGVGIPAANRRRLFQPFFTTKKNFGTGLGLWITRDLLEKKGGMIRCRSHAAGESPRSSGTVMMFFLPTAEAQQRVATAAA
jgi:PAS domain S-box-containing protein